MSVQVWMLVVGVIEVAFSGFSIDIWKQGSSQTHRRKNDFVNFNKEEKKMTRSFYF